MACFVKIADFVPASKEGAFVKHLLSALLIALCMCIYVYAHVFIHAYIFYTFLLMPYILWNGRAPNVRMPPQTMIDPLRV